DTRRGERVRLHGALCDIRVGHGEHPHDDEHACQAESDGCRDRGDPQHPPALSAAAGTTAQDGRARPAPAHAGESRRRKLNAMSPPPMAPNRCACQDTPAAAPRMPVSMVAPYSITTITAMAAYASRWAMRLGAITRSTT